MLKAQYHPQQVGYTFGHVWREKVNTKDGRWGRVGTRVCVCGGGSAGYACVIMVKARSKAECRERLEAYLTEQGDPWHCNTGSALPGCTVRSLWFVTACLLYTSDAADE